MRIMGLHPYNADPDVWMKSCITHYENVRSNVDDLIFIGWKPQEIVDFLSDDHAFNLKGVGKPSYHLVRNIAWGAYFSVANMLINHEIMFG